MEVKDCLLIVIRASPCLHQQCKFQVHTHAGLCFKMVHSSAITAWLVGFHCGSTIQEKNEAGQKSDDGQKYGRAGEPEQTAVVTTSVLRYGPQESRPRKCRSGHLAIVIHTHWGCAFQKISQKKRTKCKLKYKTNHFRPTHRKCKPRMNTYSL